MLKMQTLLCLMLIMMLPAILCDVQESGKTDSVSYSLIATDTTVQNVQWCGSNTVISEDKETIKIEDQADNEKSIIFVLSDGGMLYRSTNYGKNFTNFTETIYKAFPSENTANIQFNQILISPADSQLIFFFGTNGVSFYSNNCGEKLEKFTHDAAFMDFRLNRVLKSLILAHREVKCINLDEECEPDEHDLFVSEDQGKSFRKILTHVTEATWDRLIHFALVPDTRIIALHRIYIQGKNNDRKQLSYSDDFFKTKEPIVPENAVQFFQSEHFLFILSKNITDTHPNSFVLKIAPSFSQEYFPQDINLPIKRIKDHSFTVLDTLDGQVLMAINHEDDQSKMSNVYISDQKGIKYTLSLINNVRNRQGNNDFERILSNDGTYIANVYDQYQVQKYKERQQEKKETHGKQAITDSIEGYKKTFISFDRGSSWHTLKAPKSTAEGEDIICSGECSLHLKGRTENNGNTIYSADVAPGIILGTGNTGIYLETRSSELNTYLSRDGGHNWIEIKNGSYSYEIGDHGGIIVIAKDDQETNKIEYSWDEGMTWEELQVSSQPFQVTSIQTEPSNMEQKFIIYGHYRSKENQQKQIGVVVSLDFSTLHKRVCSGHWEPDSKKSDYETWVPINYAGQKCLFGQKATYVRRKREAQCFNPQEFEKKIKVEQCECSEEDYECEYGFFREDQNGPCVYMKSELRQQINQRHIEAPPENCNGFYEVATGYRKIPGNVCVGGVNLNAERKPCPVKEVVKPSSNLMTNETYDPNDVYNGPISFAGDEDKIGFFSKYKFYIVILAIIIIAYLFKDKLLSSFNNIGEIISKPKQQHLPSNTQRSKGKGNNQYEQMSLFQKDDEEEI